MLFAITSIVLGMTALAYLFLNSKWHKWQRLGVVVVPPKFPFGSVPFFITRSESINEGMSRIAKETNWAPVVGAYVLHNPIIIVQDPDLAKTILVKDFASFHDRVNSDPIDRWSPHMHQADRIVNHQIILAPGESWKNLRTTFNPIFSFGKIKAMIIFINETASRLVTALDKFADNGMDFEAKSLLGKFSMDTIASCAFGVDAKVYESEASEFVKHSDKIGHRNLLTMLKYMLVTGTSFGPKLLKALNWSVYPKDSTFFFYKVLKQTIRQRQESKMRRNDMIDLMVDAIKGDLDQEQEELDQYHKDAQLNHKVSEKLDEFAIITTALFLLVASDTTGSTLGFMSYQLAINPGIQDKLRQEVDAAVDHDEENVKYEDLQRMHFMDQVISEVLRYYSPLPGGCLDRNTTQDYKLRTADMDIPISKNTEVMINVVGIHSDPRHYANPDRFDPEHFNQEAKKARHPYAYMPFGQGPHNCIAMKFALVEMKLVMTRILKRYTILPSDKTKEPVRIDPYAPIAYAKDGLFIKLERRS